jgi:adenosine kinase
MATVGEDFAEYRTWLEEMGVDTSATVEVEDQFTSSFFVNTDQDNNQIASFYLGAMGMADSLSFHDLDHEAIEVAIISPNAPAAMVKYARECQELGISYIYDPSQQIVRLTADQLLDGMRGANVFIANEYEFGMIRNKSGWSEEELLALPQVVVITLGGAGSRIYADGAVLSIPVAPAREVREPTGAGDAYRAGLIKGLLRGLSWQTVGRMAALAATYVLEQYGTMSHSYTFEGFVARYHQVFGDAQELENLLPASQ